MLFWIAPLIFITIVLGVASLVRLKISRDGSKEGDNDRDTIQAYDSVSRWLLFSLIRYGVLRQLKKYQPEGMLLDIGCGPGYLDIAISTKFPQLKIIGIDISPDALELAVRNQLSSKINPWISYQEADMEQLPFECNSMDFIVSTLSMHHLDHPDKALREIFRILKPNGQLLIFDLRRDMPVTLFNLIHYGQKFLAPLPIRQINGGVGSVWSSFTPAEVQMLLSQSPFPAWKIQKGWGWYYAWGRK